MEKLNKNNVKTKYLYLNKWRDIIINDGYIPCEYNLDNYWYKENLIFLELWQIVDKEQDLEGFNFYDDSVDDDFEYNNNDLLSFNKDIDNYDWDDYLKILERAERAQYNWYIVEQKYKEKKLEEENVVLNIIEDSFFKVFLKNLIDYWNINFINYIDFLNNKYSIKNSFEIFILINEYNIDSLNSIILNLKEFKAFYIIENELINIDKKTFYDEVYSYILNNEDNNIFVDFETISPSSYFENKYLK